MADVCCVSPETATRALLAEAIVHRATGGLHHACRKAIDPVIAHVPRFRLNSRRWLTSPTSVLLMKSSSIPLLALLATGVACQDSPDARPVSAPTVALTAHATQRASFQVVGADTLSDSTRITRIIPEPDGDGVILQFADPARRVVAGLAIVDRKMAQPQLLWPDSVTAVWWTGPHMLAFTTATGAGVRLVVDVHAATLKIADTTTAGVARPPDVQAADESVSQRATAYIDSLHLQPGGASQPGALKYSVTRLVPSPDGTMVAFYSVARDPSGALTNPSWFVLDRSSGTVAPLDRITGAATELQAEAGDWSGNTSFIYAKGRSVWEAEIQRASSTPPQS